MPALKNPTSNLLPEPHELRLDGPALRLSIAVALVGAAGENGARRTMLAGALATRGLQLHDVAPDSKTTGTTIQFDRDQSLGAESYRLIVSGDSGQVRITGGDAAGQFHGAATLAQLIRTADADGETIALPGLQITDAPAFPERGVLLDVSRDRIPTLDTLFDLVDRFASWKLNRLQLYTEHTFAYPGHEIVWGGWDPLTPSEIERLASYCRERFIELVPNQQSFGHLHHWLRHAAYRHLAECPEGVEHPFSREREPFSLCATDPRSLDFLAGLYDQLLPHFTSDTINVGLDETFDLGQGRSRAACQQHGTGRVYLDFLQAVHARLNSRGRRMQFWADIILKHPTLVPHLPRDSTPMLWGYEAAHPFEQETATVAAADLPFTVCPGTSSWQSIGGRTQNMLANLSSAATHGHAAGARGLLITDWGDRGHLQPLPVSYPGWATAAALAWNVKSTVPARLADLLDLHAFDRPDRATAGSLGMALLTLGSAGEATGVSLPNASPLFRLLTDIDGPLPAALADLTRAGLTHATETIDTAQAHLPTANSDPLVHAELEWSAALLHFACHLGHARIAGGREHSIEALPSSERERLTRELTPLVDDHRHLWLERCRPGGLDRSIAWLTRLARRLH